MEAIFTIILLPVLLLNLLGGIVGFVWLAVQGEWKLIFPAGLYAITGPFLLSLLLMPGILLAMPAMLLSEKGSNILAFLAGIPSMLWTFLVFSCSVVFMFSFTVTKGDASIPSLLWAYATSLAPWSYMAQKEQQAGDGASGILTGCGAFGMISMAIAVFIDPTDLSFVRLMKYFLPFVGLAFTVQLLDAYLQSKRFRY